MPSEAEGSVTGWIAQLELEQADDAQCELWRRYFHRLVHLARQQLGSTPRRVADEEDVAIAALTSFFDGARQGRFPDLHGRHDLWPLLVKMTACKALDQQRHLLAKKRGGGHVRGNSVLRERAGSIDDATAGVAAENLQPEFLVSVNEECQRLMSLLPDDQMRQIARQRLEGYTNAEIARSLDVVERTVERRIGLIRDFWAQEIAG